MEPSRTEVPGHTGPGQESAAAEPASGPDESGVLPDDVIVIATQESAGLGNRAATDVVAEDAAVGADRAVAGAGAQEWSEIKATFVDDPAASLRSAYGLVERAIEDLATSVRQRQELLAGSWREGDGAGTEEFRTALREYRGMYDQLAQMALTTLPD